MLSLQKQVFKKSDLIRKFSCLNLYTDPKRCFTITSSRNDADKQSRAAHNDPIRLSKLIASRGLNMQMSRKSAEMLIENGLVTFGGEQITDPGHKLSIKEAVNGVKVAGRLLRLPDPKKKKLKLMKDHLENSAESCETRKTIADPSMKTRVWLAHKLPGELVSEHDPEGRPSLIERLERGGVGKPKRAKKGKNIQPIHLKPIGRLDMITEGLILITNDGQYKREMELPSNEIHRTYRVRVHGLVTPQKLKALRSGMQINGTYYKGMKVNIETNKGRMPKGGNTNQWLRITCLEGKNRQIRRTLDHLGLKVTRLIRISFGDYDLNTIPPGLCIEVPLKRLENQRKKGPIVKGDNRNSSNKSTNQKRRNDSNASVQWIRHQ